MKNIVLLLFALLISPFVLSSCSNDDEPEPVRYYVKYVTTISSRYIFGSGNVTVSTENGSASFSKPTINETFGPVSNGFECKLKAKRLSSTEPLAATTYSGFIYVSYNNEPFVLKATTTVDSDEDLNLVYRINF